MADVMDYIAWAMRTPVSEPERDPRTGQRFVSSRTAEKVLICLAFHADDKGRMFPSQRTVAEKAAVHRSQVQASLEVLEKAGLIARDGKAGRTQRWRLTCDLDSSHPRTGPDSWSDSPQVTGPDSWSNPESTGPGNGPADGPGVGPGVGPDSWSITELNRTEPPYPPHGSAPSSVDQQATRRGRRSDSGQDKRQALRAALSSQVSERDLDQVVEMALSDRTTTGNPLSRIQASAGYVSSLVDQVRERRNRERQNRPRCEQHSDEPFDTCNACRSDVLAGDRPQSAVGKIWPPQAPGSSDDRPSRYRQIMRAAQTGDDTDPTPLTFTDPCKAPF